jgi:hypothetical protein
MGKPLERAGITTPGDAGHAMPLWCPGNLNLLPMTNLMPMNYTGLGIGVRAVDAFACRFPQENGTLHVAKYPT